MIKPQVMYTVFGAVHKLVYEARLSPHECVMDMYKHQHACSLAGR